MSGPRTPAFLSKNRPKRFHALGRNEPPPIHPRHPYFTQRAGLLANRALFPDGDDARFAVLQNGIPNFPDNPAPPTPGEVMAMRKRTRNMTAPVASTSSVNYNAVNRVITLTGREYWSDIVVTGTSFTTQSRLLRPTDSDLFSWSAQIAAKFEEFKFSSLKFRFEPQVSTNTAGSVGLYFDGDPTHNPPANWNNFINTGANTHAAVWAPITLNVPAYLFASRASYYTRSEFEDANSSQAVGQRPTDPLEYYPGVFGWVAEGAPAGTLGKVYIEYTCSYKTQNVDGFNLTSTSGALISGEEVANSGAGYWYKCTTFSPNPFGATPLSFEHAGTNYFADEKRTIGGILTPVKRIVQNVDLIVVTRATAAVNITCTLELAPPAVGNIVFVAIAAPYVNPIEDSQVASTDRCQFWQVRLPANSYFRVTTAGVVPTYFHMLLAPFAFALQS